VLARARTTGADVDEQRAVLEALRALRRHPWIAASKGESRAVPIAARAPDGSVLEGTIDLVREEGGALVAVRVLFAAGDPTEAQRAEAEIAAAALAEASGKRALAALLVV
jgi:hypothetical protein